MKKAVSVFAAVLIVLSLCSCSGNSAKSALTVNGTTEIDSEIFTYFLNEAVYGGESDEARQIENATSKCLEYAAVNTRFSDLGERLSSGDRAKVSLETNSLWRSYGAYFSELGISKETFFKIKQYEYRKEALRFSLYDTDGVSPINEDYIKQYFTSNYVGIKYFYEELYTPVSDGEYGKMSETEKKNYAAEKQAAEERYKFISGIANYVDSGVYSMDEAFMAVTGQVAPDISVSAAVVGKNDSAFSEAFISAVFKQSVGSAFIITNAEHSYVYFLERVNLLEEKYGFYEEYRDICLKAVSESFFVSEINSGIQAYEAVRHTAVVDRCMKKIKSAERSKYVGAQGYVFKSVNVK